MRGLGHTPAKATACGAPDTARRGTQPSARVSVRTLPGRWDTRGCGHIRRALSRQDAAPSAAPDAVDSPRAVREAFYYPYSCKAAVETYSACMKEPGDWRRCAEMRDAMDSCLEIGERRRFTLDSQCMRWKRKYQACILQGGPEGSCASTIEQLTNCIQEAA